MSAQLEQRLRTDMDLATRDLQVPSGLAERAHRQYRRRLRRVRAVTMTGAAVALVAGGVAVAGAMGAFGSAAPGIQRQPNAYVIAKVERALAAPSLNDLIGLDRITLPYTLSWEPLPGGLGVVRPTGNLSAAELLIWTYGGRQRAIGLSASGQRMFDLVINRQSGVTSTAVLYGSKTWWRQTTSGPAGGRSAPPGCQPAGHVGLQVGPGNGWPAFIESQLACGAYTVVGRQVVDGVDTLEIAGPPGGITVWVNPSTYLPVRMQAGPMQINFEWLPATAANLAELHVSVPAGFRQVPPPARPSR